MHVFYRKNALRMLMFIALLWFIEVINNFMGHRLNVLGIYPAANSPVPGIFFAPLLHGSFDHLALNTLPLFTFGWLISLGGFMRYVWVSLFIAIVGGVCVWIFGRNAFHVGASGLIFGYFGFLVAQGIFEQSFSSVFIASSIIAFYGSMIFGILPLSASVSWETHLFSLLAGVLASRLWSKTPPQAHINTRST